VKWLVPGAVLTLAAAAALASRFNQAAGEGGGVLSLFDASPSGALTSGEPDQAPDLFDQLTVNLDPRNYLSAGVDPSTAAANVRAFLDVIGYSEGADYDTLFGGGTFDSYADHPRQYVTRLVAGRDLTSSAAGKFQLLARTWDPIRARLQLPDFSPASQDAAATELIRERGALRDVQAGRFATAIDKVRRVWASLPGAGYGQPERSFTRLQAVYQAAGGTFESQA
jgi:muramidase (phage lysozyme)